MGRNKEKVLIVYYSYHYRNTEKIAVVIAECLAARLSDLKDNEDLTVSDYALLGLGGGIDSGKHYREVLDYARALPITNNHPTFIFSTAGVYSAKKMIKDHNALRKILVAKGYEIVGEFSCLGHDSYSFLKYFGGINKGRPNQDDLTRAKVFAKNLNGFISRTEK